MKLKFCAAVSTFVLFISLPAAHAQIYRANLLGSNEIPVVNTPATGFGVVSLNRNTHEMRVKANFTGLTSPTTAAHVHCCVVQPANAGVATTTPAFVGFPLGVTSGSWDRIYDMTQSGTWNAPFVNANGGTPAGAESAFLTGVAAGQSYLNIHTTINGGGEIRGILQLFQFSVNPFNTTQIAGVAGALDSLGAGTGALNDAFVNMAFLSPDQLATALSKLTPNSSRGRLAVTTSNFDANFDLASDRIEGLRWKDRQKKLAGSGTGFWVGGHGENGRQYADSGFAGYEREGWGVVGGVDRRLENGTFLGGTIGFFDNDLNYREQSLGNSDDISTTQLSFYIGQDIGRFFVQGAGGYAWQRYDSNRDTGQTGLAIASFDGHQWGGRATAGLTIGTSSVSFTPKARLTWSNDRQDAYNETGGGALGLAVAAKSVDSLRSSLGGQADFGGDMGGVNIRPFLRGFWNHNLDSKERDGAATFLAGGTTFFTPGQKLDRDALALGAGVNVFTQGKFSAGFNYDLTLGEASQLSALHARLQWNF